MSHTIRVSRRFCGPPNSANGGYACGLLAGYVGGDAEVRLHAPPPLECDLSVDGGVDGFEGGRALRDGARLMAEARALPLALDAPAPVSFTAASRAARDDFVEHPFPSCFVCGPARAHGDGLRIHPGPLRGSGMFAAPWMPHESLADGAGVVRREMLWAALDCPGVYACGFSTGELALLGTMHAHVETDVMAGERCTVLGWKIGAERRKHFAGTAIFGPSGDVRALARTTWIRLAGSVMPATGS